MRPHVKYVLSAVAAVLLLIAGGASAFVISHASSNVVQPQPPAGTCHVRGKPPFNLPDLHCTPGALNAAVTQATIRTTICRSGYSSRIRPSTRVTAAEKLASMRSYGLRQPARSYEYDHLISLELGGAANDGRNLWPEPGASPNLKDQVENLLHKRVCDARMSLARAQQIIALDWASYYKNNVKARPPQTTTTSSTTSTSSTTTTTTATTSTTTPAPQPPYEGVKTAGAFCTPPGATAVTTTGKSLVCKLASDGRYRWLSS